MAEEEVLLSEQQAAGGGGAGGGQGGADATPGQQALADHPSSILDGLTATDVNKMKVCVCVLTTWWHLYLFFGGGTGEDGRGVERVGGLVGSGGIEGREGGAWMEGCSGLRESSMQ